MQPGRLLAEGALVLALIVLSLLNVWLLLAPPARAEVAEVATGYQYGLTYLPLMVMQDQGLVEKQAKAAGLDVKASWRVLSGPAPINDGLLSGDLNFGAVGTPSIVLLWSKTRHSLGVKAVGALAAMPMYLNTNDPAVHSLVDFSDKDKIAVPSVKIGVQAVTLQMAAAKAFGMGSYDKLDRLTVGMGHPEAYVAILSGHSELTTHFSSPPFQTEELERGKGKIHTVLKSYDVLGGPATFTAVAATDRFRTANPKVYAAYVAAFEQASKYINDDHNGAAALYVRMTHASETPEWIAKLLADPDNVFDLTPRRLGTYASFMAKVGTIKEAPASWKDLVHPNLLSSPGS